MIVLGLILLIIGLVADIPILTTIGAILLIVGLILNIVPIGGTPKARLLADDSRTCNDPRPARPGVASCPADRVSSVEQPVAQRAREGRRQRQPRDQRRLERVVGVRLAVPDHAAGPVLRRRARAATTPARGRGRPRRCGPTRWRTTRRTPGRRSPRAARRRWPSPPPRPSASAPARRARRPSPRCRRTRPRRRPPSPRGPRRRTAPTASSSIQSGAVGAERGPQVQRQPGPLQPVADGRAVRAERVGRACRRCSPAAGSTARRSAPAAATRCRGRGRAPPGSGSAAPCRAGVRSPVASAAASSASTVCMLAFTPR